MNGTDNYEPFGEEWEAEVMKLPKKMIIDLYKKSAVTVLELREQVNSCKQSYTEPAITILPKR